MKVWISANKMDNADEFRSTMEHVAFSTYNKDRFCKDNIPDIKSIVSSQIKKIISIKIVY